MTTTGKWWHQPPPPRSYNATEAQYRFFNSIFTKKKLFALSKWLQRYLSRTFQITFQKLMSLYLRHFGSQKCPLNRCVHYHHTVVLKTVKLLCNRTEQNSEHG